jgi:hypothetical protein
MLPPGHIAAGYLVAESLLAVLQPEISSAERSQLLFMGAFWGFAPDLDTFIAFAKARSFTFKPNKADEVNHRKFSSHAPVIWLLAGLFVYGLSNSEYGELSGLLLWLCSWSHFFLDTIQYGIMWLWPWKRTIYAFRDKEYSLGINAEGFFNYWWSFVKAYSKQVSFYLEIFIIFIALVIYFI